MGGNVEVWDIGVGGLPGGIETRLEAAFDAVEIGAPYRVGIEYLGQGGHRDGQFGGPEVVFGVQVGGMTKTAFKIIAATGKDVQVDPEAIGADLKFLVVVRARGIWLQKKLCDIAIPEVVAAAVGAGVVEDEKFAISAEEAGVKGSRGPQQTQFGFALRITILTLPVAGKAKGVRAGPVRGGVAGIQYDFGGNAERASGGVIVWFVRIHLEQFIRSKISHANIAKSATSAASCFRDSSQFQGDCRHIFLGTCLLT